MEIAIYAEGGGDTADQKSQIRQGLDTLLASVKSKARERKVRWRTVPAGGRDQAYSAFLNALQINPEVINVLLVDSETQVMLGAATDAAIRTAHLAQLGGWNLSGANPQSIHLMVRCMETWIVADPDALAEFYGQRFARNALPTRANLEEEPKQDIYDKLKRATRDTQKGEYGKIKDAGPLLQKINPSKVEGRCPRFATFINWLSETVEGN
jgi:Domain of unknown function (DUF4276)